MMVKDKPQMVTCDVTTLKIFLKHMQPLNDKISGLKVQVAKLKSDVERLHMENARLTCKNKELAQRLTEINHDYNELKEWCRLKDEENND